MKTSRVLQAAGTLNNPRTILRTKYYAKFRVTKSESKNVHKLTCKRFHASATDALHIATAEATVNHPSETIRHEESRQYQQKKLTILISKRVSASTIEFSRILLAGGNQKYNTETLSN